MVSRDVPTILKDAAETLETATWGLADLLGDDPRRRMPGLRNLVAFGVATTQALQALRGVVPDFDDWYMPKREAMRNDELLKYFWKLRIDVLHKGGVGEVSASMNIEYMNTADLQPLTSNPPPGAREFFVGDHLGGSGWKVELADGTIVKYYVGLPSEVRADFKLHLPDPPLTHLNQQLTDTSIGALAELYIDYLRNLMEQASDHFSR